MTFLSCDKLSAYCRKFNEADHELYSGDISNQDAETFLAAEIPRFDCPDPVMREIWYFRWWSFRKHVKSTPYGRVLLEFMPDVSWAGAFNTINCPAAHQLREARWFRDKGIAEEYLLFWLNPESKAQVRRYTFGPAFSARDVAAVTGNKALLKTLLPALKQNFDEWKKARQLPDGMFWQEDGLDGMEVSIGGSGIRATINSCMAGEAYAIGAISGESGYAEEGKALQQKMEAELWNPEYGFFMNRRRDDRSFVSVRELHGYTPWYYLELDPKYDAAWKHFSDPEGFAAPCGLTTAEQRHRQFRVARTGHCCQWNGPVWPFATTVTLTGLEKLLHRRSPESVGRRAWFAALTTYARGHYLRENGKVIPWIDENMDPYTGSWLAREILQKNGKTFIERGKDYSHSAFADLVITGLCGLEISADGTVSADPLLPAGSWEYFLLDGIFAQGKEIALQYDRDGSRYGRGPGLTLYVNGEAAAHSDALGHRITAR